MIWDFNLGSPTLARASNGNASDCRHFGDILYEKNGKMVLVIGVTSEDSMRYQY